MVTRQIGFPVIPSSALEAAQEAFGNLQQLRDTARLHLARQSPQVPPRASHACGLTPLPKPDLAAARQPGEPL